MTYNLRGQVVLQLYCRQKLSEMMRSPAYPDIEAEPGFYLPTRPSCIVGPFASDFEAYQWDIETPLSSHDEWLQMDDARGDVKRVLLSPEEYSDGV